MTPDVPDTTHAGARGGVAAASAALVAAEQGLARHRAAEPVEPPAPGQPPLVPHLGPPPVPARRRHGLRRV